MEPRDSTDSASIDPRLTEGLHLTNNALRRLRPGRPVEEVTDADILASREDLASAVPKLVEVLQARVEQPGRSDTEDERAFLAQLQAASDRDLLTGDIQLTPENRPRWVTLLRWLAAAVASTLIGIFLEAALGALGVTGALEHAAIQGAQVMSGAADQLGQTPPALVTAALLGAQVGVGLIMLDKASELLDAERSGSGMTTVDGMEVRGWSGWDPVPAEDPRKGVVVDQGDRRPVVVEQWVPAPGDRREPRHGAPKHPPQPGR